MGMAVREILIPLLGTILGASCVFFVKGKLNRGVERSLLGFAAGVMVAACFWSLILPSFESSAYMGKLSFLPPFVGFWAGILFLYLIDKVVPHLHRNAGEEEGAKSGIGRALKMFLAVAIHNLPEGMAVGAVIVGAATGEGVVSASGAFALMLGITIQNFPEGAIISLPLKNEGMSRGRAFLFGAASGLIEPIGAILTIALAGFVMPALPYFLSFAAGAMMYVVVEEIIPEMSEGDHSNTGAIIFAVGFSVMMVLNAILG